MGGVKNHNTNKVHTILRKYFAYKILNEHGINTDMKDQVLQYPSKRRDIPRGDSPHLQWPVSPDPARPRRRGFP